MVVDILKSKTVAELKANALMQLRHIVGLVGIEDENDLWAPQSFSLKLPKLQRKL